MSKQVEVQLKKKRFWWLLVLNGGFMLLCLTMLLLSTNTSPNELGGVFAVRFIAGLATITFSIFTFYFAQKIWDPHPGVILNDQGIFDHSGNTNVGFIGWDEVIEVKESRFYNHDYILLVIKNPKNLIAKQPNWFKRQNLDSYLKLYKTPVCINVNNLDVDFDDMKGMILTRYFNYSITPRMKAV